MARLRRIVPESSALANYRWGEAADSILRDLTGADEVVSIDMSDYEGASIVHDMKVPLADRRPDLGGQLDLVIDGGTLEHVFNFPVAVANLMFLVRRGGYILSASPQSAFKATLLEVFHKLPRALQSRIYDIKQRNTLGNPRAMRRWRGTIE